MLFENNYDTDGIDLTYLNIPLKSIISHTTKPETYSPQEGFLKGNMFEKEFDPYKNYGIATFRPVNRKEELKLKLYEYDFALNDLNLYLDLHPEDMDMFNLFKKYVREFERIKEEYIKVAGPLSLTDTTSAEYNWLNKWPWESKGGNI